MFSSTEFVDRIKHTCSNLVGGMTMSVQLAPRPKNEERRVAAVKRTGIIDSDQSENFAVFCEIAKALTKFDYVSFSLFDETFQCNISSTDVLNEGGDGKSERTEFNVCSYVLLSSEPTLIPDMRKHERWKTHPKVLSGEGWLGYAGFPVINKDNYALGTFCLLNKRPAALNEEQIQLIKGIAQRIAHQIDIQTNQRETTVDAVQSALKTFTSISSGNNLSLFNNFLSVCSGKSLPNDDMKILDEMGLTENSELSSKGKDILRQMKLQPKVMKKKIVSSKDKPQFLDDLLGEL
jgi:hypothetical protein